MSWKHNKEFLLRECAQAPACPLSFIFKKSQDESYIPDQFKEQLLHQFSKEKINRAHEHE